VTFLKKFGLNVLKIVGIVAGVFPVVQGVAAAVSAGNQTVQDTFTKIGAVVMTAEAMGQAVTTPLSGADKLKAAAPLVAQVVQTSELLVGKKVKNEAAFAQAIETITGGVADLLNSLE